MPSNGAMTDDERRIVEWLRADAQALYATGARVDQYQGEAVEECADAIERGDHRK